MNIEDMIYRYADPVVFQAHHLKTHEIAEGLIDEIHEGKIIPFYFDDVLILLVPENNFVARIHILSVSKNTISAMRRFKDKIFEETSCRKLYGFSPDPRFIRAVKKVGFGWKHEGTLENMFFDKELNPHNLYVFGVSKET